MTIVFDALGVDGRRTGKRAAEAFLDKGLKPNTFVSIFRVDQRLSMVAPFTNDRKLLEQAIDRATSGERFGVTDEREAMAAALKQMEGPTGPAAGEGGAPGTAGVGENAAAQAQARAIANMLRLANELQAQQQGGTSLYPLLALMKGQKDLAGRKTLIYVTEWLGVPPSLEAVFRSVISEANRSNVSVYAIDARGLQTEQAMAGAREMLDRARNTSVDTMQSGGGGAVSKEEIKLSETAEGALRANVEGILQDLAEGTGGFHVSNTNNFKPGAEKIAADISGYYELTYTPPPFPFDGAFRTIEVRVARKDLTVHTRNGYFALPPGEASAVFPYEVQLLGALSVENPPNDLTLRAAALRFGDDPRGGRDTKIVVEVPIADLKMTTDELTATYNLHLSLLAAVKGQDGEIVQRYSEDYPFEGPIERAEALKMGNIVFKRRLGLPPGGVHPRGGGAGPHHREDRGPARHVRGTAGRCRPEDELDRPGPTGGRPPGRHELRRPPRPVQQEADHPQPRRPDLPGHEPQAVALLPGLPGGRCGHAPRDDHGVREGREAGGSLPGDAAGPGPRRDHPVHRPDSHRQLSGGNVRREGHPEAGLGGVQRGDRVHPRALRDVPPPRGLPRGAE